MNSLSSFFSSFVSVVHADEEQAPETAQQEEATEAPEAEAPAEEEEEEEPEDEHPAIREECKETKNCVALAKHFEHCQEKVTGGEGFKGEDCVEELMMHCVDDCAAPKLFAKLK